MLAAANRDFLEIHRIIRELTAEELQRVQIRPGRGSQKGMVDKLRPFLGDSLRPYQDPKQRQFIGFALSDEELILNQVRRKPHISSKKLRNLLPMTNARYFTALNALLESGSLLCTALYESHIVAGLVCRDGEAGGLRSESAEMGGKQALGKPEKRELFRNAYQVVGRNRNYVLIHQLRRYLAWPRGVFDSVLTELSQQEEIILQGGDPSELTPGELEESFTDEFGYLRIAVSWRK